MRISRRKLERFGFLVQQGCLNCVAEIVIALACRKCSRRVSVPATALRTWDQDLASICSACPCAIAAARRGWTPTCSPVRLGTRAGSWQVHLAVGAGAVSISSVNEISLKQRLLSEEAEQLCDWEKNGILFFCQSCGFYRPLSIFEDRPQAIASPLVVFNGFA